MSLLRPWKLTILSSTSQSLDGFCKMKSGKKRKLDMKNELKIISIVGVAAVLAGCESVPGVDPGPTSYIEADAAMTAMAADYIDEGGNALGGDDASATPWVDVPDNTSPAIATYNGYIGGDVTFGGDLDGLNLVGELELTADFGAESISATADNFYDNTGAQYTGELITIVDGTINRDEVIMFDAVLEGDLSNGGPDYATVIGLEGWFIGQDYEAVGGQAIGTADGGLFTGVFVAKQ
jgi:hypothetical protein